MLPLRLPVRLPRLGTVVALVALGTLAGHPVAAQDYYADIRPLLVENCVGCHNPAGIAWSMGDAEKTFERATRIARAVTRRRMPPWLAEPGHQSYVGDRTLSDAQIEMVQAWAAAGYPKGEPRPDPAPAPAPAVPDAAFRADLSIPVLPSEGYLPDQDADDDYHCFLVDWAQNETGYVTGFRAVPGNRNVAHHVVVYAVDPDMADRYREADAEEEGPGYRCFGGAVPDRLGDGAARTAYEARYPDGLSEMSQANHWLAHWAPGMDGHVFPAGTGIRVEPGTALVVQMHYYSSNAPGEKDADTHLDFMVAPTVERPAFHLAQTRGDWLVSKRSETMVIPPGTRPSFEVGDRLGDILGYVASVTGVPQDRIEALEVHSANLHMHSFGHSGEITLTWDTGQVETLLSVPRWDLAWQRDFTLTEPKVLPREILDDSYLSVRCTYDNSTDAVVYGGYGSMEEMCFNFSYIAVRSRDGA